MYILHKIRIYVLYVSLSSMNIWFDQYILYVYFYMYILYTFLYFCMYSLNILLILVYSIHIYIFYIYLYLIIYCTLSYMLIFWPIVDLTTFLIND